MVGLSSNIKSQPRVAVSVNQRWAQRGLGRKAELSEEQRTALLILLSSSLSPTRSVLDLSLLHLVFFQVCFQADWGYPGFQDHDWQVSYWPSWELTPSLLSYRGWALAINLLCHTERQEMTAHYLKRDTVIPSTAHCHSPLHWKKSKLTLLSSRSLFTLMLSLAWECACRERARLIVPWSFTLLFAHRTNYSSGSRNLSLYFGFLVFLISQLDETSSREICSSLTLFLLVTSKSLLNMPYLRSRNMFITTNSQTKFRVVGIWLQKRVTEPLPSSWVISAHQTLITQNYSHGVGPEIWFSGVTERTVFFPLPKWKASKQTFFVDCTKKADRNGEGQPLFYATNTSRFCWSGWVGEWVSESESEWEWVSAAAGLSLCPVWGTQACSRWSVSSLPPYLAVSPVRPFQWSTWVGSPSAWTSTTRSSHPAAFPGPSGTPLSTMPKAQSSPDTSQSFTTSR